MFLSTVEAIRDRDGKDDTSLNNDVIEAALRSATTSLSAEVRTTFDSETAVVDLFYVRDSVRIGASTQTRLLTSRGFLKTSPVVKIETAARSQWFVTFDGEVIDLRAIAGVDYTTIDHTRGLILITGKDISDRFVQVTYDCGFAVAVQDGLADVFQSVPTWLVAAAELQVEASLEKNPALRSDEDTEFSVKELLAQKTASLGINVRYEPDALSPIG